MCFLNQAGPCESLERPSGLQITTIFPSLPDYQLKVSIIKFFLILFYQYTNPASFITTIIKNEKRINGGNIKTLCDTLEKIR